jgi:hypothetical protein
VRSAGVTPTLPSRSLRRSATLLRKAVTSARLTSSARSVAAACAFASLSASRISRSALRRWISSSVGTGSFRVSASSALPSWDGASSEASRARAS